MRTVILCIVMAFVFTSCSIYSAVAHELTPTYPEIKESHIENVYVVKLETYNRREEVRFYEIQVLDKDMEPIVFATTIVAIGSVGITLPAMGCCNSFFKMLGLIINFKNNNIKITLASIALDI